MDGMQSVARTLRALETLAEHQPLGVSELARRLGLPKATAQRILVTLAEAGWIHQTGTETTRWRLTPRALTVAQRASEEMSIREVARDHIVELGRATNETVHLSVLELRRGMVLIDRVDCDQPIRTWRPIGSVSALHATSTGLAAIAHLPEKDLDEVIGRGLERFTETTVTDPDALKADLAEIRRRGYSVNHGRNRPDICAIGAPILDSTGRPVGAVCITMPAFRFDAHRQAEWGAAVAETGAAISGRVHL